MRNGQCTVVNRNFISPIGLQADQACEEKMLLEILCVSVVINVAVQQESFEQQDERERQYEYESRYYAKPEGTRSTVGKFVFLKMKGEIRNDDPLESLPLSQLLTSGRNRVLSDLGIPFPIPLPPMGPPRPSISSPFPSSPLQHLFSHPLMPDWLPFSRLHGFFETDGGGHFLAMSKIFSGSPPISQRRQDAESNARKQNPNPTNANHHEETSWPQYEPNQEKPIQGIPMLNTFDGHNQLDSSRYFFQHMPHNNNNQQHSPPAESESYHPHHMEYEHGQYPSNPSDESIFFHPYGMDESHHHHWPAQFKTNGKIKSKLFMPTQEAEQFECHCPPFGHDWSRFKRCAKRCASKQMRQRRG